MRVEEMYLIEAEAVAMSQGLAAGQELLNSFMQTYRDPNYFSKASTEREFQIEVLTQMRIEFWGEGLATKDIKRLQKGVIRSYPGTNHYETNRYNKETTPDWMNFCIVQTETNYNTACTNNPEPDYPLADSPEVTSF
jgi:hypothetical protein